MYCKKFAPSSKGLTCQTCSQSCIFCKRLTDQKFPVFVCKKHSEDTCCCVCGNFAEVEGFACEFCEAKCCECCYLE
ncbi:Cysteine-rich protein [Spironucleus salmonicida]|uniref:Cysteine-rich protein n=1 Tax=Spironucleus salmonicida TaxID=348837 RepID=V6LAG3_9EUKA|nr:Cysteine-rich protein [Spironucleus salmonicida]|eukprot:EST41402.1 Cysteine-rich protein [Spironucleus salmonicida]